MLHFGNIIYIFSTVITVSFIFYPVKDFDAEFLPTGRPIVITSTYIELPALFEHRTVTPSPLKSLQSNEQSSFNNFPSHDIKYIQKGFIYSPQSIRNMYISFLKKV